MVIARISVLLNRLQGEEMIQGLQENTFLFFLLVLFLLLLGLIRILDPSYFNDLFRSMLDANYIQLMKRDRKLNWNIVNMFLDLIFLGSITFYIFQLVITSLSEWTFWQIFLAVFLGNMAHLLLNWLMGILFYGFSNSKFLLNHILIFNRVIGIIFLPILFLITYFSGIPKSLSLNLVGFLLILILGYRMLRAIFQAGSTVNHGIIYNFFYLCITEITPLIIVIEFITRAF